MSFWSIWFHLIYIDCIFLAVLVCRLYPSRNPVLSWIYSYINNFCFKKKTGKRSKSPIQTFSVDGSVIYLPLHISHGCWKLQIGVSLRVPPGSAWAGRHLESLSRWRASDSTNVWIWVSTLHILYHSSCRNKIVYKPWCQHINLKQYPTSSLTSFGKQLSAWYL